MATDSKPIIAEIVAAIDDLAQAKKGVCKFGEFLEKYNIKSDKSYHNLNRSMRFQCHRVQHEIDELIDITKDLTED